MILDGKLVAGKVKEVCAARIKSCTDRGIRPPKLTILQVNGIAASDTYVRNKKKDCEEVGIKYTHVTFDPDCEYPVDRVQDMIARLGEDPEVDGIMCQLPMPGIDKYYERQILSDIPRAKDVDGLRPDSICKIMVPFYNAEMHYPCTPHGVMMLLNWYDIDPAGKKVMVIGRSNLVTKPLAQMLLNRDAQLTICHSKIPRNEIAEQMYYHDIIISAVGKAGIWDASTNLDLRKEPVLIDIGTSVDRNGKLHGDFEGYDMLDHFGGADEVNYTPVPGGVGPMTRAALMLHVVDAWENNLRKRGELLCSTKELLPRRLMTEYQKFNEP